MAGAGSTKLGHFTALNNRPSITRDSEWGSPMVRANHLAELRAFAVVAGERSFRRAAAQLNVTPSTLSHSLRSLEESLGVRLLNRTTRTVSLTEPGEALLRELESAFSVIENAVERVNEYREKPRGTVRLNVSLLAAQLVLAPVLARFARTYPEITLEISIDDAAVDVVKLGCDAGIRFGESLQLDMVAVPVSPKMRIAVVGSPGYWEAHPAPHLPEDLKQHRCIGYRAAGSGMLLPWEFERAGHSVSVDVRGQLVVTSHAMMVMAALEGAGVGYATEAAVEEHLASGRLVRVLEDWCPPFPGFFLYFADRRASAALRALIEMVRAP